MQLLPREVPALGAATRWGLTAAVTITFGAIVLFYRRQAGGAVGGAMSLPKAMWLAFAVLYWFFVCPLLGLDERLPRPYRTTLLVFSANMWARGLIELYMLYGPKNWKPRYGVGHAIFSLALLAAVIVVAGPTAADTAPAADPWDAVAALVLGVLAISLVLEAGYALAFNAAVQGRTTGDDGLWFADADDPKFRLINRVTALFNAPLYAFLVALVGWSWGLL